MSPTTFPHRPDDSSLRNDVRAYWASVAGAAIRRLMSLGGSHRMFEHAAAVQREFRTRQLFRLSSGKVLSGPFHGMVMPENDSWGDGDLGSKILGCYELNLHPYVLRAVEREPSVVVNVGCAEGYYAVGFARLLTNAAVHAFDINPKAQEACSIAVNLNNVSGRTTVSGLCTSDELSRILSQQGHGLVVMDCEGAESDLINPNLVPELARADILVETHDFIKPGITQILTERLSKSHQIEQVAQGGRDVNGYPQMNDWPELERYVVLSEARPSNMSWLVCWSRQRG